MTIADIFNDPYMLSLVIKALTVGFLVSLCASVLGVCLVLDRFSMIGDGLSHVGFFALSVATVLKMSDLKLEIAMPIVVLAALLIFYIKDKSKINGDASIAVISTGAIAVGSILFNFSGKRNSDICNSLFGSSSVITLTDRELIISIVLSVVCLIFFFVFYSQIFSVTFDESFARATGLQTKFYRVMTAVLTAVTIVVGMEMMGAVMISALVVFPALSSMRVCKSFKGVVLLSALLGVICFVVGFFAAVRFSFQTGPAVVSVHVIAFIIFSVIGVAIAAFKKKTGK